MDPFELVTRAPIPFLRRCRVPKDLEAVTRIGVEAPLRDARTSHSSIDRVWRGVQALYRTGVHPAIQVCIRRRGHVVMHRSIGHAAGNAPDDPIDAPLVPLNVDTPFCIFSASKAVTAMVIHKLDEQGVLHLEDRVADFIPEFASHGKHRITIRHLLAHKAGIPNLPPNFIDLDLLADPDRVIALLAASKPTGRPGRWLAYHAVSGGFVLAEIVRRATGRDIRDVLDKELRDALGVRWLSYGVPREDIDRVVRNACTGPPAPPPIRQVLKRALGVTMEEVVKLSNDPRWLTGVIPAANIVTTALDLSAFFQCLLDEGTYEGRRVFEPRTVRRATAEHNYWEIDLTLGLPLRYGLGFMLGGEWFSLFGYGNPNAFGHVGYSNIFAWADPDRDLSVALLTSGKPVASSHVVRLLQLLYEINRAFPRLQRGWEPD